MCYYGPVFFQVGTYVVLGKITLLEEEFGWFYPGCRKCSKKVLPKAEYLMIVEEVSKELEEAPADSLWCPRCRAGATSVVPKYKIIPLKFLNPSTFYFFPTKYI